MLQKPSLKRVSLGNSKILHEELCVKKLVSRWIPYLLTKDWKAARLNRCQKTLDLCSTVAMSTASAVVMKINASRPFGCSKMKGSRQKSSLQVLSKRWSTYIAKADHVATIFLQNQRTGTADWYTTTCLQKVIAEFRTSNLERRIILHQDNASRYTARKTIAFENIKTSNCYTILGTVPMTSLTFRKSRAWSKVRVVRRNSQRFQKGNFDCTMKRVEQLFP